MCVGVCVVEGDAAVCDGSFALVFVRTGRVGGSCFVGLAGNGKLHGILGNIRLNDNGRGKRDAAIHCLFTHTRRICLTKAKWKEFITEIRDFEGEMFRD